MNTDQLNVYFAGVRERAELFNANSIEIVSEAAKRARREKDDSILFDAVDARLRATASMARDEAHKVVNFVRIEAARQAQRVAMWNSLLVGNRREKHVEAHGQAVKAGEAFTVNGKQTVGPGQFGDPSEDRNCKCYVTYGGRADDVEFLVDEATNLEAHVLSVAASLLPGIERDVRTQLGALATG